MYKFRDGFNSRALWSTFTSVQSAPKSSARSAIFFPLAGFVVGLLLVACNYLLAPRVDPGIVDVTLIAVLIAASRAQFLRGLRDTFDGLGSPAPPCAPVLGLGAVILTILLKNAALNALDEQLNATLLLSPVLARWAVLPFLFGYHVRCEVSCRALAARVSFSSLLVASAATVGLTFYFFGRMGLWLVLGISIFTLLLRSILYRRQGALSYSHIGAVVETVEALSLSFFASL